METQTLNSMIMKKTALILLLAMSTIALAQKPRGLMDNPEQREKIEAMRIAFITEEVELSPDQAKVFWPVYDEFQAKMKAIRTEQLKGLDMGRKQNILAGDLTDSDLDKIMNQRFADEQQELDLKIEYHEKFKEVLEIKQVAKLYKAQHEFKRQLFERMRGNENGRPMNGKGPR